MPAPHLRAVAETVTDGEPGSKRWLKVLRMEVDASLVEFFEEMRHDTERVSPKTVELVDEIEALTMRGGKRLRPAIAAAGYRCVRPGYGMDRLVELSCALELLQSYLLIHDDWMDEDEMRRGGPAVHASLQRRYSDRHLGSALGVLTGDLAGAYAWDLFLRSPYPTQAWPQAASTFIQIQKEVYCGQQLDLLGDADVARMHALKTTSYSVRGPLLLGAMLGNPSDDQLQALSAWADPIGEAFQIRDDLLGALGTSDHTGKPAMDLPHGKVSSVLAELRRSTTPGQRKEVEAIVGRPDCSEQELRKAQRCLRDLGIVERLETQITERVLIASRALDRGAATNPQGRAMLTELAAHLTHRTH